MRNPPWIGLLEIACGAGNALCFRFLVGFCGLEPTDETLRQALASGNNELVRDVWNRLSEVVRVEGLVSFAKVSADFHNDVAFAWLLRFAEEEQLEKIACFVARRHRAGPLVTLVKAGSDITRSPGLAVPLANDGCQHVDCYETFGRKDRSFSEVLKAAPPARLGVWLWTFCKADAQTRTELVESAPASKDFVRFLLHIVNATEEGEAARAKAIAETVDHVIAQGGGAWGELLKRFGVHESNSPAEARALLASGFPLGIMQSEDELAIATWLYPERVQGMLEAGADVGGSAALHLAAAARSVRLTKLLLTAGAVVDRVVNQPPLPYLQGGTALCVAARVDAVGVAELLVEAGATVDPLDVWGRPLFSGPLTIAAENGSFAMVRFLVSKGAKLDIGPDERCLESLNCALGRGHYDIAAFLIEAGATFNAAPLYTSTQFGSARRCHRSLSRVS
jgi:hypothetical protein